MKTKRTESKIMAEILEAYNGLSPENLCCDGEASRAHINHYYRLHSATLKRCFKELGRTVEEGEAYDYYRKQKGLKPIFDNLGKEGYGVPSA